MSSVIVYKSKNYVKNGEPMELTHKIFKNGSCLSITCDSKGRENEIIRWKQNGNLWERHHYMTRHSDVIEFYKNGFLHNHRVEPAYTRYEHDVGLYIEKHYENGLMHRLYGPAFVYEDEDANICIKEYWINGKRQALKM